MPKFSERLKNGWNAFFKNRDPTYYSMMTQYDGYTSSYRPDRYRFSCGVERTIITAIQNRIATDCASIDIEHVRLDENKRYLEDIPGPLNNILKLDANIDQTGRAFLQDAVMSLLDEGCVALVPVEVDGDPIMDEKYKIFTIRTGQIMEWKPDVIRVRVYNDRTGLREDILMPKKICAIVENPFYSVMNEPNSILKRLVHKLSLLDAVDEESSSGKLNLIIQLPYVVKTENQKQQAEKRRKDIENQLSDNKYGVAYTDGTERITQLNRSIENNLLGQIEYLTSMLYGQLGLTPEIMNGSANEATMLNYYNRTIEPILTAIVDEMNRKFLTEKARKKGEAIQFHRDPFKLVPVNSIADIGDKLTRNEILSSNEVRGLIGFKPVQDERANELRNKNLNAGKGQEFANTKGKESMDYPNTDGSPEASPGSDLEEMLASLGL